MGCSRTRTNYPPQVRFALDELPNMVVLRLETEWLDCFGSDECHQAEWKFFVNENEAFTLPFSTIKTPITIGIDSNYEQLNLPNGPEDIIDFLEFNGIDIENGDSIKIEVHVINCRDIQSENPAVFELIQSPGNFDWLTENGETWETMEGEAFEHF